MNEKIEVIYPSNEEIREQIDFIVEHSASKSQVSMLHSSTRRSKTIGPSLQMIQLYLMLEKSFDFVLRLFDIQYVFQQYLEVIVVGIILIFGFLMPSTS